MKFYKYWAKASEEVSSVGSKWRAERFGASNVSVDDAKSNARQLATKTAEALRRGEMPDSYLYSDRPVREEIVEVFGDDENPYALITRNAYGSLVLNTARVMFADIDFRRDDSSEGGPFRSLFGVIGGLFGVSGMAMELLGDNDDVDVRTKVANFVDETPGLGVRLYRTAAGYRCLITSQEYDPLSAETQTVLVNFESDPLYIKLCQVQECFRARLTPKFWRCRNVDPPPVRFPWADAAQEQSMRAWEQAYGRAIEGYATCEFLESFGSSAIEPQIEPIVQLHDRLCCHEGRPLA